MNRETQGALNYQDGLSAEDAVARAYCRSGAVLAARRWRGKSGEIDLVLRNGSEIIVVEVKKARDFDRAASSLSPGQLKRIWKAAEEFVAQEPLGQLTPIRIDLALVNGRGEHRILENITQ